MPCLEKSVLNHHRALQDRRRLLGIGRVDLVRRILLLRASKRCSDTEFGSVDAATDRIGYGLCWLSNTSDFRSDNGGDDHCQQFAALFWKPTGVDKVSLWMWFRN